MTYTVAFTRRANAHLLSLYEYIAQHGTPVTAERYTSAIVSTCRSLSTLPERSPTRPDIFPGLRVTHHKGRTIIAYMVDQERGRVVILGIYYGGQDFESDLLAHEDRLASELRDALGDSPRARAGRAQKTVKGMAPRT